MLVHRRSIIRVSVAVMAEVVIFAAFLRGMHRRIDGIKARVADRTCRQAADTAVQICGIPADIALRRIAL